MYKENDFKTSFAFIAGATIAAGVALLFAPRPDPKFIRLCASLRGRPKARAGDFDYEVLCREETHAAMREPSRL